VNLNGPHLHLIFNHLPVVGMVGSTLLLLVALFVPSSGARRMALFALVVTGLAGLAAYFTGDPAAHVVGHLPGIERARIHEHDQAATFGLISASIAGLLALVALLATRRGEVKRGWIIACLVVGLWGSAVMARVAELGGEIRHTEIRNGFVAPPRPAAGADSSAQAGQRGGDDGD